MKTPSLHPIVAALAVLAAGGATLSSSRAATLAAPGDPGAIPGVVDFEYDSYWILGGDHVAEWVSHTDAYSWDHPNLASANPEISNQTGWTHLSRWIAFSLTEPARLTIRIDREPGVLVPDQNNPGEFVPAGDDLIPAFTLWRGFEALREDSSLGLGDPAGGHRFDNDGDGTSWMDQLAYQAHDGNLAGAPFVEAELAMPAGDYTMNIAGNKGGAFDPGTEPGDLRKGFRMTLTTIPEPGTAVLVLLSGAMLALRRRTRHLP